MTDAKRTPQTDLLDAVAKHEASYAEGFAAAVEVVTQYIRKERDAGCDPYCCGGYFNEILQVLNAAKPHRP